MNGAVLRKHREALGLTTVELARVMGLSQPSIVRAEQAERLRPATFARYCEGLVRAGALNQSRMLRELADRCQALAEIGA